MVKSTGEILYSSLEMPQNMLAGEKPASLHCNLGFLRAPALDRIPCHLMSTNTRNSVLEGIPLGKPVYQAPSTQLHRTTQCYYLHFINSKRLHSTYYVPGSVPWASHDINSFNPHSNPMRQGLSHFTDRKTEAQRGYSRTYTLGSGEPGFQTRQLAPGTVHLTVTL